MRELIRDLDRAERCLDGLCSVVAAAVVGGVSAIGAASIASKGSQKAAQTVANSAQDANQVQMDIFNKQTELQEPWRQAGIGGLNQYAASLQPGADLSFIQNSPGYKFGMDQGVNAINSSAATRGLLNSGANLKNLNAWGQDYAGTKVAEYRNPLAALAGIGQTATNQMGAYGADYASAYGKNAMNAGNARASAYQQNGANWGNAFSQIGNMGATYLNNRQTPTPQQWSPTTYGMQTQGYTTGGYLEGLF
jgi:hypothetical protein